jgi:hypothetical protein
VETGGMSSQHTTFESSCKTAGTTQAASVVAAEQVRQVSIDAVNSVVGYNNVSGNNALLVSTTITANIAKLEALANAEKTRQASTAAAREILKNAGTAESAGPF